MAAMAKAKMSATATDNPLLENWTSPFGVPPFARIRPGHFLPDLRLHC
jgi:peptidyl-dipeptidase Dcp